MVRGAGDPGPGGFSLKEGERSDANRLDDMRDAVRRIARFIEAVSITEFQDDPTLQDAVAFRIMALGEAAGRVSKRTRNANPKVDWKKLSSFRNEPAHEYYALQPERLWQFAHDTIPLLERQLRTIRSAAEEAE